MTLKALILAGTRAGQDDAVAQVAGVSCKAFAPIDGIPMIEHVIQILRKSTIDDITISLPNDLPIEKEATHLNKLIQDKKIKLITPEKSPVRSILRFVNASEDDNTFLITTADHALLSRDMIDDFINQYNSDNFDTAVAMLPLNILTAKYPSLNRTRLKFKDGNFKGCNLFLFKNKQTAERILNFWKTIETQRKKPWKMVRALGPFLLLRYLTGRLSLDDALTALGRKTDLRLQAVMLSQAEAAIDVDTPDDLEFAQSIVARRASETDRKV